MKLNTITLSAFLFALASGCTTLDPDTQPPIEHWVTLDAQDSRYEPAELYLRNATQHFKSQYPDAVHSAFSSDFIFVSVANPLRVKVAFRRACTFWRRKDCFDEVEIQMDSQGRFLAADRRTVKQMKPGTIPATIHKKSEAHNQSVHPSFHRPNAAKTG
jgi:hypothetical protein